MDAFFLDPKVERFPPEAVRILELHAIPYPDGQRLRVSLELTPFLERPNIELDLVSTSGDSYGSTSLVEPIGWKLELTMHIRSSVPTTPVEQLSLIAILSYPGLGETDRRQVTFHLSKSQE